jgi:hypothetical protein
VKLENKFSGIPLVLPLAESMEEALPVVKKACSILKSQFGLVYASYAMTRFLQKLIPRFLNRIFVRSATSKITCAFSNTPGPIKSMYYEDLQGKKIYSLWSQPHFIVAGQTGLAIVCMSFVDCFRISVTSDEGVFNEKNTERLCQLIESNINQELIRVQNKESKKKD